MALRTIISSTAIRNGTITTKVSASFPPIINAIVMANISISGALMAVRISIMKDICTLFTSVVILVTRDEEENLSIF